MSIRLELLVKDGPHVGQVIKIENEKCTFGGKGSQGDLLLSGVPYGVVLGEFKKVAAGWQVSESQHKTLLLNQKRFKRRNFLKSGDVLTLPSRNKDQTIRYEALVTIQARKSSFENPLKSVNPTFVTIGGVYLVLMLGLFAYFALVYSGGGSGDADLSVAELESALTHDIEAVRNGDLSNVPSAALNNEPQNFTDLKMLLKSARNDAAKDRFAAAFKDRFMARFSEAYRLESQGRFAEAELAYRAILVGLDAKNAATAEIVMQRLNATRQ